MASKQKVNLAKILGTWLSVLSILTAIGGGAAWVMSSLEHRIIVAINTHDHGYESPKIGPTHEELRQLLGRLEDRIAALETNDRAVKTDLKNVYWYLVGYEAADVEPRKDLRAAAAAFYRDKFMMISDTPCSDLSLTRCRSDGKPYLSDAYRLALQKTWLARTSIIRNLSH